MGRGAREAHRLLILCSPAYQRKVHGTEEERPVTGVGVERMLFWSAIWNGSAHRIQIRGSRLGSSLARAATPGKRTR